MKKINNILLAIAALVILGVMTTQPCGQLTKEQITINAVLMFLAIPAWIAGLIKNNPELTK